MEALVRSSWTPYIAGPAHPNSDGRHQTTPRKPSLMKDNRPNEIHERLLKERIIFLGGPIDEAAATLVIAKVLYLIDTDNSSPITLYVNSPGGSVPSSFGIIDAIDQSPAPVTTVCMGRAFGTAAMIVAHGRDRKSVV